jgi:hypothetical protein
MIDRTSNDRDALDDAIDRAVREMTDVAADDRAVARVMARLRESGARETGMRERWTFAPRVAWAGAAAVLLVAIAVVYSLRSPAPDTRAPRLAERPAATARAAAPSASSAEASQTDASPAPQAQTVRETPTAAARAASRVHATTVARDARDMQPELPLESDIEIVSITPAPLDVSPAIHVEPLTTSSLHVDAIPLPSIEMSPVGPERNE